MAGVPSVPSISDRLVAKVNLQVYLDKDCKNAIPPLPPGPMGLKESTQFPGSKKQGDSVGVFTGNSSTVGYEVFYTMEYEVHEKTLFGRNKIHIKKDILAWVRRDQVTGNWDKGPDAPKESKEDPPPTGNTTMFIGMGVAAAAIFKMIKQNSAE